jgi:hypothetical protein
VSSELAALVFGLAAFAAGVFLSESMKSTVSLLFRRRERRVDQVPAMRSVVLHVDPDWQGSTREDGVWTVAVLEATLTVENHSDQLIKNVRAAMRRRPEGVNTAPMVPAIAARADTKIVIKRELGLYPEDQPFEEDETPWLNLYWFEVLFEDTHGNAWRLYYNPRDEEQTVERQTS